MSVLPLFVMHKTDSDRPAGIRCLVLLHDWLIVAIRGYLERALNAHGGFGAVAGQIGWSMAYIPKRPRGYWDSILNVKSEVDDFIEANGLQPGIVPSLREVRGADR